MLSHEVEVTCEIAQAQGQTRRPAHSSISCQIQRAFHCSVLPAFKGSRAGWFIHLANRGPVTRLWANYLLFTDVCYTAVYEQFVQNTLQPRWCLPRLLPLQLSAQELHLGDSGISAPCSTHLTRRQKRGTGQGGGRFSLKSRGRFCRSVLQMLMHAFACIHFPLFLVFLREITLFLQCFFPPVCITRLETVLIVHHLMHFCCCCPYANSTLSCPAFNTLTAISDSPG